MKKETEIVHAALTYKNSKEAEIFFKKILGLKFEKSFELSENLTEKIFGVKEKTKIDVYCNDHSYFEIFISKKENIHFFDHICIKVDNKKKFIERCKENKISPIIVTKGEKKLLFVRDYAGNLFEIKE